MNKFLSAVFVFMMAFHSNGFATHAAGADITYKNLGNNLFRITLTFYRDCGGNPGAYPTENTKEVTVNFFAPSCPGIVPFSRKLTALFGTGKEVTPICPLIKTTCSGGLINGIRQYVYEDTVTLADTCEDWIVSYAIPKRNNAITTIQQPGLQDLYVEAHINNTSFADNNSSPVFSQAAVPFICVGQNFCFNHGAKDAEGDSLVFSLITPMNGAGTSVSYNPGYSYLQPVTSNPAFTFNDTTGGFCFTPQRQEVAVIAVLVKEYRNDTLLGSVIRDMQIYIVNCNNSYPYTKGINNTGADTISACAGDTVCFNIFSFDPDAGQSVTMRWDTAIGGATFSITPGQFESGRFCWNTGSFSARPQPYNFTVTVTDNNCPAFAIQVYTFSIYVKGPVITLTDVAICDSIPVPLCAGSPAYTYLWSTGDVTPCIIAVSSGIYSVTVQGNGCTVKAVASVTYDIPDIPVGEGAGYVICGNDSVLLDPKVTQPLTYTWSTGDTTKTIWVKNAGTYCIIPDSINKCFIPACFNLSKAVKPTGSIIKDTTICDGDTVQLWVSGGGSYSWDPVNSLDNAGAANPLAFPDTSTTYKVIISNGGQCTDTVQVRVMIDSIVTILTSDTALCLGSSVQLSAAGGGTYSWTPSATLTNPATATPTATPVTSTTYTVTASYGSGCTSVKSIKINVDPVPAFNAGPDIGICLGSSANLLIDDKELFFIWSPSAGLSCTTCPNPTITIDSNITYYISGFNGYCYGYDTINVFITSPPIAGILADDSICYGTADTIYFTGTASPSATYAWDFGDGKILSGSGKGPYVVSWAQTGIKKVRVTVSEAGCPPSTTEIDINVRCRLIVPNVITPNGDGPNDLFFIEGIELFLRTKILVYNRWGLLIYESDDYKNDWDGTIDGKPLSDGVYYYLLYFSDREIQKGFFTILRNLKFEDKKRLY